MIFKYIKNTKKEGNKVSARYKYVSSKADWIYENTLERFDFAVKRRFGKKQDTTHYVISFDRELSDQEKEKAREVISNFFFQKFGINHYLSIAEHNDKENTHYHILLSRDIETSKMVNSKIKAKEWKELQKELRAEIEKVGILTEREKELNQKYLYSTEHPKTFGQYEYRSYKELQKQLQGKTNKERLDFLLSLFETDKSSYKAIARATTETIAELLNNAEIELLNSFLEQAGINIFLETTQKGRERIKISFTKDWKFLEGAKTTTFRISNLNRNIANELKKQLKELQNGIKEFDRKIFEQNRGFEESLPKVIRRTGEVDRTIGTDKKGDKTSTGRKEYDIGRIGKFEDFERQLETENSEFAELKRLPSTRSGRRKNEIDEFEELARRTRERIERDRERIEGAKRQLETGNSRGRRKINELEELAKAERERVKEYRERIARAKKQLEELERLKEQEQERKKGIYIDIFGTGTKEPKKEQEKENKNPNGITLNIWNNNDNDSGIGFDR